MARKVEGRYGERDSPFFRLRSKKRLAKLLCISSEKMKSLARQETLYYEFKKEKSDGSYRQIHAPRDDLKKVQKRIAALLQRIVPPDYLFAPVAGRSYVDNAAHHLSSRSIRLLDIEDFFPSCTANKVFWFFHKRMECSRDVAAILRGVITHNGSLPQGSPCSPILAYFSYVDMWEEIFSIVQKVECKLSVYSDDLTISGDIVPENAIWRIKKKLYKHGHRYQASKESSKHLRSAEVTGVMLRPEGYLCAPNRIHKGLREAKLSLARAKSHTEIDQCLASIRGREAQMNQILSRNEVIVSMG